MLDCNKIQKDKIYVFFNCFSIFVSLDVIIVKKFSASYTLVECNFFKRKQFKKNF